MIEFKMYINWKSKVGPLFNLILTLKTVILRLAFSIMSAFTFKNGLSFDSPQFFYFHYFILKIELK